MEEILKVYKPSPGSDLELFRCPFCGSKDVVYIKYDTETGERWRVQCMRCPAGVNPGYAQQRHIVQAMWNKRVGQDGG